MAQLGKATQQASKAANHSMQRKTIRRLPVVVGLDASQHQHAAPLNASLPPLFTISVCKAEIANPGSRRTACSGRWSPSRATFQPAWLTPLLISAVPGNQRVQGIAIPHWRDALKALR
ncbi:hypothetical protein [Roseateles sp. LYH14W]|uniref:Uncharacterized protein n=1 Tax=Pelomonas parva TaxID=3299032 RepID=A0ABW7F0T1_9BURK